MPFINKTEILIQKSNKNSTIFNLDKNIVYNSIDSNFNKLSSHKIIDGNYCFVDIWLDINNDDSIYGVINDKKGKLLNVNIKDDVIDKTTIIKYDYKDFFIKFPYIKNTPKGNHLIYYLINKNLFYSSNLIHIYIKNDIYVKKQIDFIDYNIMSNFIVTWDNNTPSIFYFKFINGSEELFISTFNLDSLQWSVPLQITNSKKSKIYLSVIRHIDDSYHIVFSENNNDRYYCRYINGYLKDGKFNIYKSTFIRSTVMCLFPHLIEFNSTLYAQWVEYHDLYTCKSNDLGETWSAPILCKSISNSPFLRYEFRSNYNNHKIYTLSTVFGFKDCFDIYNILPKY